MKQLNVFEKQMLIYRIDNLKNLSNKDFMVSFAGIVNDFDLLQKEDIENLHKYVLSVVYPGFDHADRNKLIKEQNERIHEGNPEARELLMKYREELERLTVPVRTSFIVEEPEQNLYPFTQIALLEAIVKLCSDERSHGCTVTTHSPFILNYLNVLIERYNKNIPDQVKLNPEELCVYSVSEGRLSDLMQVNTKTGEESVNAEDLVEAMRAMYQEYREIKMK